MPYLTGATIPLTRKCRTVRFPSDPAFLAAFNGALLELTHSYNWEQYGALTADEMAAEWFDIYEQMDSEVCMEIPVGSTNLWWNITPPDKWLECDGTGYSKTDYPELFAVLGYTHGGSGDTFQLPDMRSVSPMGVGAFINLGESKGATVSTIAQANLPAVAFAVTDPGHDHTLTDPGHNHTLTDPGHVHAQGIGGSPAYQSVAGSGRVAYGVLGTTSLARVVTDNQVTGATVASKVTGATVASKVTGVTVASGGSGTGLPIVHPVRGCYFIIYAGH